MGESNPYVPAVGATTGGSLAFSTTLNCMREAIGENKIKGLNNVIAQNFGALLEHFLFWLPPVWAG